MLPSQLLSHELPPDNGMRKERKHFLPKYFPVMGIKIFNSCDEHILPQLRRFVNKACEFEKNNITLAPLINSVLFKKGGELKSSPPFFLSSRYGRCAESAFLFHFKSNPSKSFLGTHLPAVSSSMRRQSPSPSSEGSPTRTSTRSVKSVPCSLAPRRGSSGRSFW